MIVSGGYSSIRFLTHGINALDFLAPPHIVVSVMAVVRKVGGGGENPE
jgi:hypothetical protein